MTSIFTPIEFWFSQSTELAIPYCLINFNHPVKEMWSVSNNHNSNTYPLKDKELQDMRDINFICDKLTKLCIPITYEEYFLRLSQDDKNIINNIDKEESKWLFSFMNNNLI